MKTKTHHTLVTIILAALLVPATDALSQDRRDRGVPALTVLNRIASKFGSQTAQKIVRMRGAYGQSQPAEWWVVVHDPASPTLLREFWIGDGRANNEGPSDEFYPRQTPAGFVPIKNIKLDSVDAFELLNREATKAKMGFDSVNYFLRCREFSSEPVWTLQAVDENRNIVGIVDMSAETAKVLRTVWMYRDRGPRGPLRIIDSDLAGSLVTAPRNPPGTPLGVDESTLVKPEEPPLDPLLRNPGTEPATSTKPSDENPRPDPSPNPPAPAPKKPSDPLTEEAEVVPLD